MLLNNNDNLKKKIILNKMKINLHSFNNIFKTIKKIEDKDEKHKLIDQNKHLLVNHIVKTDDNYYIIKNIINNDELDVFNVKEKIKERIHKLDKFMYITEEDINILEKIIIENKKFINEKIRKAEGTEIIETY